MIVTIKKFLKFSSQSSKAREEWHIIERIFFSQLLGLIKDKSYDELKYKLKEFNRAITNTLLKL